MSPQLENLTDEILWTKVREGDRCAFEILYKRQFALLYNYGRKIDRKSELVTDAIHDLFLDVWRYRENLFPTTSVKFYLLTSLARRMVKNETSDFKARTLDHELGQLFLQPSSTHEQAIIETEETDERMVRLKKHLAELPPRQYEALVLRFYNELPYSNIAAILEVNEQSARNLVQRGLEHLRAHARMLISVVLFVISGFLP